MEPPKEEPRITFVDKAALKKSVIDMLARRAAEILAQQDTPPSSSVTEVPEGSQGVANAPNSGRTCRGTRG